ncbi:hypothetical protein HAX54_049322 [Datura stramonium]|uniref:Pentatricopeptide repeat-containing protein n=1 Tax=Datura stramonium TaxID=4076 RepID=A0ABS8WMF5_DATST|nr:hypothetical protein [Datura stramonium]
MEHYGCMVDMFGRAGELEEAYDIIRSMPIEANSVILRSFINACKHHGHIPCTEENIRDILLKIELARIKLCTCIHDANSLRSAMKAKGINKFLRSWLQSLGSSSEESSAEGSGNNVSVYANGRAPDHRNEGTITFQRQGRALSMAENELSFFSGVIPSDWEYPKLWEAAGLQSQAIPSCCQSYRRLFLFRMVNFPYGEACKVSLRMLERLELGAGMWRSWDESNMEPDIWCSHVKKLENRLKGVGNTPNG